MTGGPTVVDRVRTPRVVLALTLLVSLVAGTGPARPAAASGPITFSIGSSVSAEDESYVREGIRLAQDFLREELGVEVEDRIIVNARATAPPDDAHLIAVASTGWVGIYTESAGWIDAPPFHRIELVVHEYVHAARHALIGDTAGDRPSWLEEGISEALGFRAVVSRGLVNANEVATMQTAGVVTAGFRDPPLPPLDELETRDAWKAAGGPAYASPVWPWRD